MRKYIFILLIFVSTYGQDIQEERLIQFALENSPFLKSFDYQLDIYSTQSKVAKLLPNPNIYFGLLNIETKNFYPSPSNPMSSYLFGFSQVYTLPIKREKESVIFSLNGDTVNILRDIKKREVISSLRQLYYDWQILAEKEKVLVNVKVDLEILKKSVENDYKFNRATLSDILEVQSLILQTDRLISQTQKEQLITKSKIDYICGSSVSISKVDLADSFIQLKDDQDLMKSPYIVYIKRQMDIIQAEIDRKSLDYIPDIEFMVEYMKRNVLPDMFSFRVGLSLPIFKSQKEDLLVLQKKSEYSIKNVELQQEILRLKQIFEELNIEYKKNLETLDIYRKLWKEKKLQLESLKLAYKYGKVGLKEIILIYQEILNIQLEILQLKGEILKIKPKIEAIL
ncbi:MAG: TolC family protein [Hydrogenothermaceae bacterium]